MKAFVKRHLVLVLLCHIWHLHLTACPQALDNHAFYNRSYAVTIQHTICDYHVLLPPLRPRKESVVHFILPYLLILMHVSFLYVADLR